MWASEARCRRAARQPCRRRWRTRSEVHKAIKCAGNARLQSLVRLAVGVGMVVQAKQGAPRAGERARASERENDSERKRVSETGGERQKGHTGKWQGRHTAETRQKRTEQMTQEGRIKHTDNCRRCLFSYSNCTTEKAREAQACWSIQSPSLLPSLPPSLPTCEPCGTIVAHGARLIHEHMNACCNNTYTHAYTHAYTLAVTTLAVHSSLSHTLAT